MKFKSALLMTISIFAGAFAHAHEETPGALVVSKALELGVHRIERLVTLKKIDPMFINSTYALRAERSGDSAKPYVIHGYVAPNANSQSSTISMVTDAKGKVVSYKVGQIYQPANPVNWPEKDAITLIEDALHFVLEGWTTDPKVKAYYLGLTSITMSAAQDTRGNLIAAFAVSSDDDARTLYIRLKTDGTFISHEIK
jgi:hypothetical protein